MMKWMLYMAILTVLSCKSTVATGQTQEANPEVNEMQQLSFEIIVQESHGGPQEAQQIEFRDAKALEDFYIKVNMTRRPGLPVPEIDFDKERIVAICLGEKTSGGYSVAIDRLENTNGAQVLHVKEMGPKPTDMVTTVMCQPFAIVKFKKSGDQLTFNMLTPQE